MNYITRNYMLYKSKAEFTDYAMNYVFGCSHGCQYPCAAYFQAKRFGRVENIQQWREPKIVANTLELLETPLLHWTDSTFAYMRERKLFFTSDAFGQHTGNNTGTDSDIGEDDLLIITADHGCDPTVEGTDHTREYVPVLYYSKGIEPKDLGLTLGFDSIAQRVSDWLF